MNEIQSFYFEGKTKLQLTLPYMCVYSLEARALDPNYFRFHKWYLRINDYPIGLNKME